MKILVYPHDLKMGGSQINAIELAAEVTRLGHECVLFGRPGELCERIADSGLDFIESPRPGLRPSFGVVRALRRIVHERGIDIIHGYEWPPGIEAALAAGPLPGVSAITTIMSMSVAPFIPRDLPLVVGTQQISALEQSLGRLNVNLIEPPVDLAYNSAVDLEAGSRFRDDWRLDDRPIVVCVSRLARELKSEGIMTAIELAGELAARCPFQLVIVGDGEARGDMAAAARRSDELAGRRTVIMTGQMNDPRPAYAAADVMLAMGGSALRSLAFGKPLVVQGEQGYFRALGPGSIDEFRWQGWYGVGPGASHGKRALEAELLPLLERRELRRELSEYGRGIAAEFSLEHAARRQITIYRDALAASSNRGRRIVEAARSGALLLSYHLRQRRDRLLGRQRVDDFNAEPVAGRSDAATGATAQSSRRGPILWFPGVAWDALAGTDRQLVTALTSRPDGCRQEVIWVDPPHSILRNRGRGPSAVSRPTPGVVRLRVSILGGSQRPLLRGIAVHRRAKVAIRYLAGHGIEPRAIVASTTAPILPLMAGLPGLRIYYATDDFVEAAPLWGVSKHHLSAAREANLGAADLTLAVTPELARHLQRGPEAPHWLPNGADLERLDHLRSVPPATTGLRHPLAGVVGQFNSRTDLKLLHAVVSAGIDLLLVGPRGFADREDAESFERLIGLEGVKWVDALSREELLPYLRAIDVGLTPYADTMFNRCSYPLKTIEYLAAGIPVVTTEGASIAGLDPRYVSVAGDPAEFATRVSEFAGRRPSASQIRRSVGGEGWAARASQLEVWLE